MKKLIILFVALTSIAAAHAADNPYDSSSDQGCGYEHCGAGWSTLRVLLFPTVLSEGIAQFDGKEAYFNELHDDAAAFLTDGVNTSILNQAFKQIRTQTGTHATDLQLATQLIQELN